MLSYRFGGLLEAPRPCTFSVLTLAIIIPRMTSSEHLAQLGREFHRRGWVLGTSGNFSAVVSRDPLRIAITASSLDKGQLTADQILEIDSGGHVIQPTAGKPSAETLLHTAIVR